MKIEKLEPSSKKQGRWLVWLEDGTLLRVGEGDVAALGLYTGMELTPEQLEEIQEAGELSRMKTKALNILSVRSISRKELLRKLTTRPRRGQEEDETEEADQEETQAALEARAEAVANWLERLGMLNDAQYAKDVVRYCGEKGYGERRMKDELFRRGVPRELWDEALEERSDSGEAIDRFLAQKLKHWSGDRKELKRATDALTRRGFSWSEISEALGRYSIEVDDNA